MPTSIKFEPDKPSTNVAISGHAGHAESISQNVVIDLIEIGRCPDLPICAGDLDADVKLVVFFRRDVRVAINRLAPVVSS